MNSERREHTRLVLPSRVLRVQTVSGQLPPIHDGGIAARHLHRHNPTERRPRPQSGSMGTDVGTRGRGATAQNGRSVPRRTIRKTSTQDVGTTWEQNAPNTG